MLVRTDVLERMHALKEDRGFESLAELIEADYTRDQLCVFTMISNITHQVGQKIAEHDET